MGSANRRPDVNVAIEGDALRISKADWIELFQDLYLQTMGDDRTPEQMMADVQNRLSIIKGYRPGPKG